MLFAVEGTFHGVGEYVLPSGIGITIRPIRPDDAAGLRDGFAHLSPESRYRRFFRALTSLSDDAVRYLTNVDGKDHVAIVAVTESPDLKTERGVGVARFIRSKDDPRAAEAAVTVVDDLQGRGIGTALLRELAARAAEVGVERFRGEILSTNEPMVLALAAAGVPTRPTGVGTLAFEAPVSLTSFRVRAGEKR